MGHGTTRLLKVIKQSAEAVNVVEYSGLRFEGVLVDTVEDGHARGHTGLHEVGLQCDPRLTCSLALTGDGQLRVVDVVEELSQSNPFGMIPGS